MTLLDLPQVDILAVGAHPDDVDLGCGGTLARLKKLGRSFGILDLTRGEMATRGTPEIRAQEAQDAAALLGASFRHSLDLGDGGLRTDRDAELAVIEVVRAARPLLVLGPLPEDRHADHVRAGRLVTDAAFYSGLRALSTGHPAHRPQNVVFFPATFVPQVSFVVDVTETLQTKLAAIRAFKSQFYDPKSSAPETFISSPAFLEGITARARFFGRMVNVEFAEGFISSRPPLLQDPIRAFDGFEPGFRTERP
jgi:bacillithiol biosynthesis deacetylase BshB1